MSLGSKSLFIVPTNLLPTDSYTARRIIPGLDRSGYSGPAIAQSNLSTQFTIRVCPSHRPPPSESQSRLSRLVIWRRSRTCLLLSLTTRLNLCYSLSALLGSATLWPLPWPHHHTSVPPATDQGTGIALYLSLASARPGDGNCFSHIYPRVKATLSPSLPFLSRRHIKQTRSSVTSFKLAGSRVLMWNTFFPC